MGVSRGGRDTRRRILAAATAEFAARGFAGAGVDRIARRARVNKALIYYYFQSKASLYRRVLHELLAGLADRVRRIAASPDPPVDKISAFAAALVDASHDHPHLAPIMLRELAERGSHLDEEILTLLSTMPLGLRAIVCEGAASGEFRAPHPVLTYFSLVGPVVFYLASAPIRAQMKKRGIADLPAADAETLVRHVREVALGLVRRADVPSREGGEHDALEVRAPR